MKILIPAILISAGISAQQKEEKLLIPSDSVKQKKFYHHNTETKPEDTQEKILKMPSLKPDVTKYSSLKDKRKDNLTDYKILNSIPPEKRPNNK